jgi:hypothetical protein
MKTTLLLGSLVAAAGIVLFLLARRGAAPAPGWIASRGLLALAGLAVVPMGIAVYFAGRGAWGPFVYNTVSHNLVPRLGLWGEAPWRPLAALPALPMIGYGAARLIDATHDRSRGVRRALVMAGGAIYFTALNCFWPLVTRQDSLPLIPIAAVFAAPLLIAAGDWLRSRRRARIALLVPAAACALEVTVAFAMEPPWRDHTVEQRRFLGEVLRLTRPGESVMDLKGESIFRSRPYYYALEPITRARMDLGIIPDDIAQHLLIARPAAVTTDSDIYPAGARAFLDQNYLPVGQLRVTGRWLDPAPDDSAEPRRFDVAIPGTYALVTRHGRARGQLDGHRYRGPRRLLSGSHVYLSAPEEGRVAVVWANALVRGFSPFLANARAP